MVSSFKHLIFLTKILSIPILTLGLVGVGYTAPVKCNPADSTTVEKITACISQTRLTNILQNFQNISDSNPDPTFQAFVPPGATAPGSRDSGTAGDRASVKYISDYMKKLGYIVTVQEYDVPYTADKIKPVLEETTPVSHLFIAGDDFSTAIYSGSTATLPNGELKAHVQAISSSPPAASATSLGCSASDFANFTPGNIALLQRGTCPNREKVLNAIAAGAVGVITVNFSEENAGNTLLSPDGMTVPVFSYIPLSVGQKLYADTGGTLGKQEIRMKADLLIETRRTYNVIAESKYGDPNSVVLLGGHYDSLFGAGILDNASGVASMMEIAAAMKDTKTLHRLRFGFWGGEELNLLGSQYYVDHLTSKQLNQIVFNLDFDVTATKNYAFIIEDPVDAIANPSGAPTDVKLWKQNAVNKSSIAVNLFKKYMDSVHLPYMTRLSDLYISGSDNDTFIKIGVGVGGMATGQGSPSKTPEEVAIFGGTTDPFDLCGDIPYVFCDNISNTDPVVHYKATKAYAAVTVQLLNDSNLKADGSVVNNGGNNVNGWGSITRHLSP